MRSWQLWRAWSARRSRHARILLNLFRMPLEHRPGAKSARNVTHIHSCSRDSLVKSTFILFARGELKALKANRNARPRCAGELLNLLIPTQPTHVNLLNLLMLDLINLLMFRLLNLGSGGTPEPTHKPASGATGVPRS